MHVARVGVVTVVEDVAIEVDDKPLPHGPSASLLLVDAGDHTLAAHLPKIPDVTTRASVAPGEVRVFRFSAPPDDERPASGNWAAWGSLARLPQSGPSP
jgi:hypothetical protein